MEELLWRFERAWRQGTAPRIEEFLPPAGTAAANSSPRRQLLEELIRLDLEYRWQRPAVPGPDGPPAGTNGLGGRPRLEDYLACHPELGAVRDLPLELIAAEYFVRHGWGDRPGHAEYLARFSHHGPALVEILRRTDAKVAQELAPPKKAASLLQGLAANPVPLAVPVGPTVADLLDVLRQGGFLSDAQLNPLAQAATQGQFSGPEALGHELHQHHGFSRFQVEELLAGRGPQLLLGPYLLLDRLGEGGTGKVFKARHTRMDRLVALKVIRQELMNDAEVVTRFYQEIKLVGQLVHPNIVHAYDAGPIGPAHVLVMEFLEGTDLARLVKEQGPLPVPLACEYVRQAALGLQHIQERGLVHRDVKPGNLLLTVGAESRVKILDLGLGRLQRPVHGAVTNVVTPAGATMMGTPDYLAPEQAVNFHGADIRADIYGLGCTLYFLLTGQPPFPGGSMAEKVAKHLMSEPAPLEEFRSDVPPGLPAVLARMMAKAPENRFQRPAEVVAALSPAALSAPVPVASPVSATRPAARHRRRLALWAGVGALLLAAVLLLPTISAILSSPSPPTGPRIAAITGTAGRDAAEVSPLAKEVPALKALILPSPGEDRWLEIPWMTSLWRGRQKAAAEGKPILLWETASHPLGNACAGGIAGRVQVFSDPDIVRMAKEDFVAVAGDDWYLRRRRDTEGLFFKSVREQVPGKESADDCQGLYCFTAGGKLLGYKYALRNLDGARELLKAALERWKHLPAEDRQPGAVVGEPAVVDAALVRVPPPGAVVVNVFTRPLERSGPGRYRRVSAGIPGGALAARDHFWLTAAEGQALGSLSPGDTQPGPVLARAIERLCRFHLLDNSRGEPLLWAPEQVRAQKIGYKVERTADHVSLHLDGTVLLATHADPARADRGYDARLHGTIRWDRRRKVVDRFDVLAVGDAWGEGHFDPGARAGRNPLGIVFELSKGEPADAVAPFAARMLNDYLGSQK